MDPKRVRAMTDAIYSAIALAEAELVATEHPLVMETLENAMELCQILREHASNAIVDEECICPIQNPFEGMTDDELAILMDAAADAADSVIPEPPPVECDDTLEEPKEPTALAQERCRLASVAALRRMQAKAEAKAEAKAKDKAT